MYYSNSKIMFISSAIMSLNCKNWTEIWILMEMNLISFSLFISEKMKFEVNLKYFCIQLISSAMILTTMIMKNQQTSKNYMLMMAITLKAGMFPFFSWMMNMMEKMSWNKIFFLTSIQKIIPMSLVMKFKSNSFMMLIMMTLIITNMNIKSFNSSKKMIMLTSNNNFSWIMFMNFSMKIMMMFFLIYNICQWFLVKKMSKETNKTSNFNMKKNSKIMEMTSISGIPPFLMFMMKWKASEAMMNNQSIMSTLILFFSASIMMNMYFKMILKSLFMEKSKMNQNKTLIFLNMSMMMIMMK